MVLAAIVIFAGAASYLDHPQAAARLPALRQQALALGVNMDGLNPAQGIEQGDNAASLVKEIDEWLPDRLPSVLYGLSHPSAVHDPQAAKWLAKARALLPLIKEAAGKPRLAFSRKTLPPGMARDFGLEHDRQVRSLMAGLAVLEAEKGRKPEALALLKTARSYTDLLRSEESGVLEMAGFAYWSARHKAIVLAKAGGGDPGFIRAIGEIVGRPCHPQAAVRARRAVRSMAALCGAIESPFAGNLELASKPMRSVFAALPLPASIWGRGVEARSLEYMLPVVESLDDKDLSAVEALGLVRRAKPADGPALRASMAHLGDAYMRLCVPAEMDARFEAAAIIDGYGFELWALAEESGKAPKAAPSWMKDPLTGKPVHYTAGPGRTLRIWSVGLDGLDDLGSPAADIVFTNG